MARRRKTSPAEDLVALIALLPWWMGVLLALVCYVTLHKVSGQGVTAAVQPGQLGTMLTQTFVSVLAYYGQFLIPLICLIGAGISAWKRRERKALVANVVQNPAADVLDGMSWRQFERLVGEAFRLQGYAVVESGGGGPDGGVDLILTKGSEKFVVQCKQWKAFKVGVDVIRELYGVMAANGSAGGFVVTSGRFTEEASRFASGRNITLIDGIKLGRLIREASHPGAPIPPRADAPAQGKLPKDGGIANPACRVCSRPMLRRSAKRGTHAGTEFWGCTGYPSCKGTRPVTG